NADIRADIYSLGCTLYYLLAGQVPFPGGTSMEKLFAHVDQTPKPLRELRHDVPETLARIMERMMAREPGQRYQTPAEVAAALTPYCRGPGMRGASDPPRSETSNELPMALLPETGTSLAAPAGAVSQTLPGSTDHRPMQPVRPRRARLLVAAGL